MSKVTVIVVQQKTFILFQRHCQVIEIFEIYIMVGKKKNPVSEGLGHILFFGFNLFLFGSNLCCK